MKCLVILREDLRICSEDYRGLTPKKGMEPVWQECREQVEAVENMIHALDNEPVRAALAKWQVKVMEEGPEALALDPDMRLP